MLLPVQYAGCWQVPGPPEQWTPESAYTSGGQTVLLPVQYSGASHAPFDGRQTVSSNAMLWAQLPAAQESTVQGLWSSQSPSVAHGPTPADVHSSAVCSTSPG